LTLLSSGSWMGGGSVEVESPPLAEESAGGAGVGLGAAVGFCGGAGVESVVEPAVGCVF